MSNKIHQLWRPFSYLFMIYDSWFMARLMRELARPRDLELFRRDLTATHGDRLCQRSLDSPIFLTQLKRMLHLLYVRQKIATLQATFKII